MMPLYLALKTPWLGTSGFQVTPRGGVESDFVTRGTGLLRGSGIPLSSLHRAHPVRRTNFRKRNRKEKSEWESISKGYQNQEKGGRKKRQDKNPEKTGTTKKRCWERQEKKQTLTSTPTKKKPHTLLPTNRGPRKSRREPKHTEPTPPKRNMTIRVNVPNRLLRSAPQHRKANP